MLILRGLDSSRALGSDASSSSSNVAPVYQAAAGSELLRTAGCPRLDLTRDKGDLFDLETSCGQEAGDLLRDLIVTLL